MDTKTIDIIIRKYQPKDRDAIFEICADTFFFGNPIDPVFSDRKLLSEVIVGYFLENEPDNAFVAEVDGEVVGYVVSAIEPSMFEMGLHAVKPLFTGLMRLITGKYKDSPQNIEFLKWFVRGAGEFPSHPNNAATAHFNIKEGYRDKKIGARLLAAALDNLSEELAEKGIQTVYGEVFMHDDKPEEYFLEMGFKIYDKKRTTIYQRINSGELYLACITKPLSKVIDF